MFEVRATLLGVIRGARPGRPGGPRARGGRVVRAAAAAWGALTHAWWMCCVHVRGACDPAWGRPRCSTGPAWGPRARGGRVVRASADAWRSWTHASWMCCVHVRGACDPAWGHPRCSTGPAWGPRARGGRVVRASADCMALVDPCVVDVLRPRSRCVRPCLGSYEVLDRAGLGGPGLAAAGSCAPPLLHGAYARIRRGYAASTFEVRAHLRGVFRCTNVVLMGVTVSCCGCLVVSTSRWDSVLDWYYLFFSPVCAVTGRAGGHWQCGRHNT